MSQKLEQLPVVDTARGVPLRAVKNIANDTAIAGGFVLKELDLETLLTAPLHRLHRATAARLLLHAGVYQQVRQIKEFPFGREWGPYTPKHIDGLTSRFHQVNTPLAVPMSGDALFTTLFLRNYNLNPEEHLRVQKRCKELGGPGVLDSIWVEPLSFAQLDRAILSSDLDREPDSVTTTTIGSDCTIVFPNGYDATSLGLPDTLRAHSVQSSQDMDGTASNASRTIAMSRIADPATLAGMLTLKA